MLLPRLLVLKLEFQQFGKNFNCVVVQSGGYDAGSPWYLGVLSAGLGCATGLLGVTRVTSSLCVGLSVQSLIFSHMFSHMFSILIIYPLALVTGGLTPTSPYI